MKKNIFNTIVPSSFNDYRIDKFLHSEITELSRTRLQTLIHEGHVKLNNIIINDPSKKIKSKNEIKINFPEAKKTLIVPNKIPLDIYKVNHLQLFFRNYLLLDVLQLLEIY